MCVYRSKKNRQSRKRTPTAPFFGLIFSRRQLLGDSLAARWVYTKRPDNAASTHTWLGTVVAIIRFTRALSRREAATRRREAATRDFINNQQEQQTDRRRRAENSETYRSVV